MNGVSLKVKKFSGHLMPFIVTEMNDEKINSALQCLIDNGIDEDEAETVLQALGYILLDEELFP